ncbi:hypothetical protein [Streptomyces sp. CA-146814]|uniref:hypothetical protein n=1 Tax=Streptomyces sp. CA-146814 TaxID=3240053 RepID=UPI003D8A6888
MAPGPGRRGAAQPWLEVYTADQVPPALYHRGIGIGVKPMTGPPDALGSGYRPDPAGSGETYTGGWGILHG